MNVSISAACFVTVSLLALASLPVQAQPSSDLSLRWFTVEGGGGLSTNGAYSLQNVIGQWDVDLPRRITSTGAGEGEFTAASELRDLYFVGGYLPGAVAVLARPRIDIRRDGMTTVVLSWQVSPLDFYVLGSTDLNVPEDEWEFLFTNEIDRAGDNWEMNLRTIGPARYFRLIPAWLSKK